MKTFVESEWNARADARKAIVLIAHSSDLNAKA
jgi:hypothetical protein